MLKYYYNHVKDNFINLVVTVVTVVTTVVTTVVSGRWQRRRRREREIGAKAVRVVAAGATTRAIVSAPG